MRRALRNGGAREGIEGMAMFVGLSAAALAVMLQAQNTDNGIKTDNDAATAPCVEANRQALESGTVTDAQWKDIISCVFANTSAQMDAQLPKKIDPITTLVSVSSNGPTFNYTYVLDVSMADVQQANIDSLQTATKQNACTDPAMTQTIGLGGSYFYRWVDRSGTQITSMLIDAC